MPAFLSGGMSSSGNHGPIDLIDDPRFKNLNGVQYVSQPSGQLNAFGVGSILPVVSKFDRGWTVEALNGVVSHGANPFSFSASDYPIPPNLLNGDGYALGCWAVSGGVAPQLGIQYGLPFSKLLKDSNGDSSQWTLTNGGHWTLSFEYCVLLNTSPTINQNLNNPAINLSDINVASNPSNNFFQMDIFSPAGYIIYPPTPILTDYIIDTAFHSVSFDFTIDPNTTIHMVPFGYDTCQFRLTLANTGHPRILIYDVHMRAT